MIADLDVPDLGEGAAALPADTLAAVQAANMALAAKSLRDLQAWSAAYAVSLEGSSASFADILAIDASFSAAAAQARDALQNFGLVIGCEGMA